MSAATVPQVLRDAADLIERGGWCQDSFAFEGCFCAVGAIVAAADPAAVAAPDWDWDDLGDLGAIEIEAIAAVESLGAVRDDVAVWNDAPGRTVTEVLAALRGAADAWEAEHGN